VRFLAFATSPGPASADRTTGTAAPADEPARLGTDLAAAVEAAAAAAPPGTRRRVVLLSDGVATAGDVRAAARLAGVPVWAVPLPRRTEPNVQVAAVEAPAQVREDEPFAAEIVVASTVADTGRLDLFVNGQRVPGAGGPLAVAPGVQRVRATVKPTGEGKFVKLEAVAGGFAKDADPADNRAVAVAYCVGRPKVLIVTGDEPAEAEPLAAALTAQGLTVDPPRPASGLPPTAFDCQPYDLIVLADLDLTQAGVTRGQLEAVRQYVRELGGGLLVVGGEHSFGPGGYARSPLEDLLPVRCDVRDARERPTLALVLVIDKSGSMGEAGKMEAAREAASAAALAVGPNDQVGVVAFDTTTQWVTPLAAAGVVRNRVAEQLRAVEAQGGTHMLPALSAAVDALRGVGAAARFKHVILITDGEDSDGVRSAPADYRAAADRAADAGVLLTTLAVGRDADKKLLRDLAARGGGSYYETDEAREVPTIVLRTAASAGRRSVKEEPFRAVLTRPTPALAGLDLDAAPPLGGYVLTRPRPGAEPVLAATDNDPLLAWWSAGLGTCTAFTSDAKRRWGREWADDWPEFGKFWAQVARRTARPAEPPGVDVQVRRTGKRVAVTVDRLGPDGRYPADDQAELSWTESTPLGSAGGGTVRLRPAAPGRLTGEFAVEPRPGEYPLRLAVLPAAGEPLAVSRGLVVGFPDERRIGPADEGLLKELAADTGGRFDPSPAEVFTPDGPAERRRVPLAPYLLLAAAGLLVCAVALRRLPGRGG
jgi:Mg-chelatase subunit ChlD